MVLNQGQGPLLREFVRAVADEWGPVSYYSPDAPHLESERVCAVRMPPHRNTGSLARLWSWFSFLVLALRGLAEPGRPLLFIVTNPPLAPALGVLAKWLKRQRYVLLFYDFYPEALERFAGLSPTSIVSRLVRWLNRQAVQHADAVVTISPGLADTLAQYATGSSRPVQVQIVPTWADSALIRPLPKEQNPFARQHGQVGKLTVLYSGNLGRVHDLTMLPQIAECLMPYPDIHFLIIGEGPGRPSLQAECFRLGLSNVTFLPWQPESTLPLSLACGDIGLVALAQGAEGISMPSKTYYAMAAGMALVGLSRRGSDLETVIRTCECGVNVEPGDVDAAARTILEWRDQPAALARFRQCARRAALEKYDQAVCVPRLMDLIRPLLQRVG